MTPIMVIRSWGGIVSRILSWQSSLLRPAQVRLLNRALRQSSARIALRAPIPMLKTLANSGFAGKRSGNVRHVQRRRLTTENGPANNFHLGRATNMLRIYFLLAMLCLSATFSVPAAAQAWTQIGTLSCRVDPNIGFIIVGHQPMQCVYTQAPGALPQVPPQSYDGALNTVGLSIGFSAGSVLGWAVFAPTTGVPAGALAGEYVGVSADVGVGLGAGANVLLGGSNRTIALQPLSLQGSAAVNVIAGVSSLKLRWH
jgi:hypothetical protein